MVFEGLEEVRLFGGDMCLGFLVIFRGGVFRWFLGYFGELGGGSGG